MANTMKAVVYERHGGPEVLQIKHVPVPEPDARRPLVKIHAAGANPVDYKMRAGAFARLGVRVALPKIPGGDLAGEVVRGTGKFKAGDKVIGLTPEYQGGYHGGTYAEYSAPLEEDLARMPATLSFEEAAGLPLAALTAYQALEAAGVKEGMRVLIHAGAGGVGSLAVQLAKARGAHVITTAGTRNIQFVKELGADEVIDYYTHKFEDVLKGRPVDVVIDSIGEGVGDRSYKVLKRRGHYQRISNETLSPTRVAIGRAWGVLRLGPTYGLTRVYPSGAQLQTIADMVSQGKVKPIVDRVYPLEEAAPAHRYLEQGHARGKVVLQVHSADE